MSEKDDIIAALNLKLDAARSNAAHYAADNRDLTAKVEQLEAQIATQRTRIETQHRELEAIHNRVVKAVVNYGLENDSCEDGMADFIAEALGISNSEAHEAIDALVFEEVTVTIVARVKADCDYKVVNTREAESFLECALVGEIEVRSVEMEWDAE